MHCAPGTPESMQSAEYGSSIKCPERRPDHGRQARLKCLSLSLVLAEPFLVVLHLIMLDIL